MLPVVFFAVAALLSSRKAVNAPPEPVANWSNGLTVVCQRPL
jgi:hypothetical protein